MKYTVIIPTMWKCPQITVPFLAELSACEHVCEILVIDNNVNNRPSLLPTNKITFFNFGKNIFVNPAWNFGVDNAQNDLICIVNDDIAFDLNVFTKLEPYLTPTNGVIGLCPGEKDFNQPPITDGSINIILWTGQHTYGFGCLFFLHKKNWHKIPDDLKVYYGDNYIFDLQLARKRTNYLITNMKFKGYFAQTTGDTSISNGFLDRETPIYQEISKQMNSNSILIDEFNAACNTYSDIYKHVPVLHNLAKECNSVVELGVRTGVSTRAFLPLDVKLRSYDIEYDARVGELFDVAKALGKDMQYIMGDSLQIEIEPTDLMFVDTVHSYEQVSGELKRHASKVRKYIAFHDTFVYGLGSENILSAVLEFMMENPEWVLHHYDTENNGLTVLRRKDVKKRILIALPTNRNVETDTLKSIYDQILPDDVETELQFFYGYQIDQIRNLIAEWGKRYDYLFCVDSDIVLPKDALYKLIQADKDIVSGLYIQRKPGQHILEVYGITNDGSLQNIPWNLLKGHKLVEVAGCGFGCVLVKGDVLRKMSYPHFVYKSALDHAHTFSEDVYFCQEARKLGFSVWVDATILCEHIHSMRMVVDQSPPQQIVEPHKPVVSNPTEDQILARYQEISTKVDLPPEHKGYLHMLATQHKIQPKVIYDIGSSVLHWTKFAKSLWPNAQIFQFEAMQHADKFYEQNGMTNFVNVLLTDKDNKEVTFYQDPLNPGGNSYYQETTGAFTEANAVKRVGMSLDTIVADKKFPLPDMIKMDTQGSELDILRGAPNVLRQVYDIIIEAQHVEYNKGAPKIGEVKQFLEANGFRLVSHFTSGNVDGDYHFKRIF